jgi:hypothetical protein
MQSVGLPVAAIRQTRTPACAVMPSYTQRVYQRGPLALIEVLRDYGVIPDERGEIRYLSRWAAALIRACGYPARAGQTACQPPKSRFPGGSSYLILIGRVAK